MVTGISIVVCCHNSARVLPKTLAHLAAQVLPDGLNCEIVIIDNASTDGTATVALKNWSHGSKIPLRVVTETRLGLSYARQRGIREAKYEVVSFVDDDNRVCPEWCQLVAEVMKMYPRVGVCGGYNEADCEVDSPDWFTRHQHCYAIGAQWSEAADVTKSRGFLWGAGLSIRKYAWNQLVEEGFVPLLDDRAGRALSSGGDTEICLALRLAGWQLRYDPRLRLAHFVPSARLHWSYLRRLNRGFGAASSGLDAYVLALEGLRECSTGKAMWLWAWRTGATVKQLLLQVARALLSAKQGPQWEVSLLLAESHWGRLIKMLKRPRHYCLTVREVGRCQWRRV